MVIGMLNKEVAARLGTTEKTVKVHRAHVKEKMGAGSLPDLVKMADRLGISVGAAGIEWANSEPLLLAHAR